MTRKIQFFVCLRVGRKTKPTINERCSIKKNNRPNSFAHFFWRSLKNPVAPSPHATPNHARSDPSYSRTHARLLLSGRLLISDSLISALGNTTKPLVNQRHSCHSPLYNRCRRRLLSPLTSSLLLLLSSSRPFLFLSCD